MNRLLSAQGGDVTSWRAAENFAFNYRQTMLELAASGEYGTAEELFMQTYAELDNKILAHRRMISELEQIIEKSAGVTLTELAYLNDSFYKLLYRHFELFNSTSAFYQLSISFLVKATESIISNVIDNTSSSTPGISDISIIALGPAGRAEYSPYCSLQLIMVHGEVLPSQQEEFNNFCALLHNGFESAGFNIDPLVTPRNADWRGTPAEWQNRCLEGLEKNEKEELINLCRLIDQYPLYNPVMFADKFKQSIQSIISNRAPAVSNLIERMAALPSGISLIGKLKLERSGSEQGRFRLLDYGLLPFSAALSVLSVITGNLPNGSSERISTLLKLGRVDVELAERMLNSWHTLHGLRLSLELSALESGERSCQLCLDPRQLSDQLLQLFTEALESVAVIKRHVGIIYSGLEA
ncbi:MAG: putative nucleotidyltransferase substrate binding domain-containing protein [Desulfuromonadaceae bacterium]|nr:putative nucleotidyltransferase substrate binding domain-containing protein [Desulfuromonadaceae bacterium]MDD2855554.1 putative nucleotidyltransferase substrate binding domain-containing protein [Desulfuromonadaceae bacterium]